MKLIVLDIDGVLSAGDAQSFDLSLFERLAKLNQLAKHDSQLPSVTLNTGRPSPYVEAIMQAIQGWQPALYEHGAGLYFPQDYRFEITPHITPEHKQVLDEVIALLDREVVQKGHADWQPGKTVCHTLLPIAPVTATTLFHDVQRMVNDYKDTIVVAKTISSIDVHPKHVTKASGLEWLAQVTQIDLSDMGGVGDSSSDAAFLKLVGYPAAPANAVTEVKAVAHYISDQSTSDALHDILNYWQV